MPRFRFPSFAWQANNVDSFQQKKRVGILGKNFDFFLNLIWHGRFSDVLPWQFFRPPQVCPEMKKPHRNLGDFRWISRSHFFRWILRVNLCEKTLQGDLISIPRRFSEFRWVYWLYCLCFLLAGNLKMVKWGGCAGELFRIYAMTWVNDFRVLLVSFRGFQVGKRRDDVFSSQFFLRVKSELKRGPKLGTLRGFPLDVSNLEKFVFAQNFSYEKCFLREMGNYWIL